MHLYFVLQMIVILIPSPQETVADQRTLPQKDITIVYPLYCLFYFNIQFSGIVSPYIWKRKKYYCNSNHVCLGSVVIIFKRFCRNLKSSVGRSIFTLDLGMRGQRGNQESDNTLVNGIWKVFFSLKTRFLNH